MHTPAAQTVCLPSTGAFGSYYPHLWNVRGRRGMVSTLQDPAAESMGEDVVTYVIEVHHLRYGPRGREPLEDLIALCEGCHGEAHREGT